MQNRRLLFGVIIKLMTFLGLLILLGVFVNSLFTDDGKSKKVITLGNELPIIMLEINYLQIGQIKKVRWNNKEVAILRRQIPAKLNNLNISQLKESIHTSLNIKTRSQKTDYFVYFNVGDSRNCPLFYAAGVFRDVCSSNRFDEAGRDINVNSNAFMLEIPPHYFTDNKVVFGKWQP